MSEQIQIYQDANGQMQIEVQFEAETVWLSKQQMAVLFARDRSVVSRHISNIFKEGELIKEAVCAFFAHTTPHGAMIGKEQTKQVEYYNLDVIISVGYRVKSKQGTQFRIWATGKLKELLVQGYILNEKRLAQKDQELKVLKDGIHILNRALQNKPATDTNEWLLNFANGLSLLDDYDHEKLDAKGNTVRKTNYPSLADYWALVEMMRKEFDSAVFGREKDQNFRSSIAQKISEKAHTKRIAERLGGKLEVSIQSGRVDILNETHAIEVEFASKWKNSIGQVLWYGYKINRIT